MGKKLAKKVLLIGWDAADWKVINPLLEEGKMPTLESLINKGVMGKITTLDPPFSPMLWTSIATGKRADKHGVLGFTEVDPVSMNVRPVRVTSRKGKALWNILTQHRMKTHVVGWWPSHPAEPINGISISNFYQKARAPYGDPWPMMAGTVHPASLSSFFADLRIHPQELTQEHLLPFIPRAAEIDQEKDKSLALAAKITAETATIQAAATWILEHEEWDFMGVYFDGIDHYCHGFMKYHPPRRKQIPKKRFELLNGVVRAGYMFHDMMLERMLQLAGDDTTVILVSDHGFHSDHLRPGKLPKEPAAPALEHSPYGIVCINGPHVKKDELIHGASILDITPTVLTMFGLPVGGDMDGKVLLDAFEEKVDYDTIESWDEMPGEAGLHPPSMQEDTAGVKEELDQLVELGYIEKLDENREKNIKNTDNENKYYLSRALINGRKYIEAIKILEPLVQENPTVTRYALKLSQCYLETKQQEQCLKVLNRVKSNLKSDEQSPKLMLLEVSVLQLSGKQHEAYDKLKVAEANASKLNTPYYNQQIGRSYLSLKKYKDAARVFRKELAINPDSAPALHGLGIAQLRLGRPALAAEHLLKSINLVFNFPIIHYHLGEALLQMNQRERAREAFRTCLKLAPHIKVAKEALENEDLPTSENVAAAKNSEEDYIVIVSGLPRSGTSMMMNMLQSGGLPAFTDNKRTADIDNKKGYFEHEAVKASRTDTGWLRQAKGKAVKVISNLLFYLPDNYKYKVIFMKRDMRELLTSQEKMLQRKKKLPPKTGHIKLEQAFNQNLKRAEHLLSFKANMDVLYVDYSDVIHDPEEAARQVGKFLNQTLAVSGMSAAVDASLYRNKKIAM